MKGYLNANRKAQKNNLLGVKGVHQQKDKFIAMITFDGKRRYLGSFDTAQEANAAYLKAAFERHGEFARGE